MSVVRKVAAASAALGLFVLVGADWNSLSSAVAAAPPSHAMMSDRDGDGIPDVWDICPGENNLAGFDRDGDRIQDRCDLDPDNDGLWERRS